MELHEGHLEAAQRLFTEELTIAAEVGAARLRVDALHGLGAVEVKCGRMAQAKRLLMEALQLAQGHRRLALPAILATGLTAAVAEGRLEVAAELLGAIEALDEVRRLPLPQLHRCDFDRSVSVARCGLDESTLQRACAKGRSGSVADDLLAVLGRWAEL